MKSRISKSQKGLVLVIVMVATVIFSILGFSVLNLAKNEIVLTRQEVESKKAFYAAEAGLEYGVAMLNQLLRQQRQAVYSNYDRNIGQAYEISPPVMEGFAFDVFTIEKVDDIETKALDSGPYKGMEALVQKYKVTSQATSNDSQTVSATLVQWVEDQGIYLFQFAAFYDQDLEIQPGPAMTIQGRIHSNNNIYLTAGNTLSIDSYLTTAANIYRSSKPGDPSEENGTVRIKDASGSYQTMDFDSTDPDWASKALARWGGKVQSQAHSIPTLSLPIPAGAEPVDIIKRGSSTDSDALKEARLYHQADLRIIDGVAYNKSGNVVDLAYEKDGISENPVDMSKSFTNQREQKLVKVTEIDVAKLVESGKLPANGILYVSTHSAATGQQDGVRLVNGSTLPARGLTVATDNPLYIQGNYNLNKAPASVLCDAINVLSNAWTDQGGWRDATNTEVNTSFISGHTPTTDAGYGGGLENFPRFLENWNNKSFTMSGSMNSLWYSEIATGQWKYGQPYYTAPQRNWGFAPISASTGFPPGTPLVCRSHRSNWQQEYIE
jgi:hypothetical protein